MVEAATKACDVFWIPFKTDCEELLGRFQLTASVRYEEFAALWRDMNFSSVFYGLNTNCDKRLFSRLTFATVYDYFLPPYNFQIRVGALYLLYGLYSTQPAWPKEKIWIALKDWMSVQEFVLDAVSCRHLDVVYVYRRLVYEKAFFYTALRNQLTFDAKPRYKSSKINELFQDRPARVTQLVDAGTLEEITNVQAHYERIKKALHVSSSVSVTPVNLTVQLQECILEFEQWQKNNKKPKNKNPGAEAMESTQQLECSKRADQLAAIKSKSYGNISVASKSRRHRQVEIDSSGPGTDRVVLSQPRKKHLSLRERTLQTLGKTVTEEMKQHWVLSSMDEDKAALKKTKQLKRFKW